MAVNLSEAVMRQTLFGNSRSAPAAGKAPAAKAAPQLQSTIYNLVEPVTAAGSQGS